MQFIRLGIQIIKIKMRFGHLILIFSHVMGVKESNQLIERSKLRDRFDFACYHIFSD